MLLTIAFISATLMALRTKNTKDSIAQLKQNSPKAVQHNNGSLLYQYEGLARFVSKRAYEGSLTYKQLLTNGGFGLAAADRLDGEVTILEGIVYQSKFDGQTIILKPDDRTPFAFVTHFSPTITQSIEHIDQRDLEKSLQSSFKDNEGIYAIKIEGKFKSLKLRSYSLISTPFPAFSEVVKNQSEYAMEEAHGTMVGFYIPNFLNGINVPGFHLHFLSRDRKTGGHLLNAYIQNGTVKLMPLEDGFTVKFSHKTFHNN
ncbi:acetolactate decarboxylase [Flagellimonas sp.]|uniref:acetolactate decarboxylase n=1 Tax=Flagellimonas sp. TaxID=2058762 RepID=UPI003BB0E9C9